MGKEFSFALDAWSNVIDQERENEAHMLFVMAQDRQAW